MKKFSYEVVFNKKDYKNFEDFFKDISKKLEAEKDLDCYQAKTFAFSCDILWEFLEGIYYRNMIVKIVFVNFDKYKISLQKNYEDYMINKILICFDDFVIKYPDNVIEYEIL